MKPTPEETAIHESCHAVLGRHFEKPVESISIEPSDESLGRTIIHRLNDWNEIDLGDELDPDARSEYAARQRRTLAIWLAGDVGNHIASGGKRKLVTQRNPDKVFEHLMRGQRAYVIGLEEKSDIKEAFLLAMDIIDGEPMEELRSAEGVAKGVLQARWETVLILAKLLLQKKVLDIDDIRAELG
jgi:hypothetical protein